MKKKVLSALLACILLICAIPIQAYASEEGTENDSIIYFEDGSSITVSLVESSARASGTKTGRKTYTYKDANGVEQWVAVLTASFTYTGTSSTCTSASCTVTISDSAWYEVSKTTTRSGNTATTELVMGEKFLGITFTKLSYTLTLTCDANGNLS